jgi:hypothetical protein
MSDETTERLDEQEAIIAYQSMEIDALRIALGLVVDATMTVEQRAETAQAVQAMKPQLMSVMQGQAEDLSPEELEEEVDGMVERILEHFQAPATGQNGH